MTIEKNRENVKGFSLVEIVVAIGLVALLLSGVMGLMGVSAARISRNLAKEEGEQMIAAFEAKMNSMPYVEAYAYAANLHETVTNRVSSIICYSYNGAVNQNGASNQWLNPDGTPVPYNVNTAKADVAANPNSIYDVNKDRQIMLGQDYQVVTVCRTRGESTTGWLSSTVLKRIRDEITKYPTTGSTTSQTAHFARLNENAAFRIDSTPPVWFTTSTPNPTYGKVYHELQPGVVASPVYLLRFKPLHLDTDLAGNKTLKVMEYTTANSSGLEPDGSNRDADGLYFTVQVEAYKLPSNDRDFVLSDTADMTAPDRYQDTKGKIRPVFVKNVTIMR
jgi:type II secretory pathway pseudopilin PulG